MSSLVALLPAITAAGSPGVRRKIRKTTTATVNKTGISDSNRCIKKRNMGAFVTLQGVQSRHAGVPTRISFS